MKKIFLTIILCLIVSVCFAGQNRPEPEGTGTWGNIWQANIWQEQQTFLSGIVVGGTLSRVTFSPSVEYIDGATDDLILFQGVGGGTADVGIEFNLDAANPEIYSKDTAILSVLDRLKIDTETSTAPFSTHGLEVNNNLDSDTFSGQNSITVNALNNIGGTGWQAGSGVVAGSFTNQANSAKLGNGGNTDLTVTGFRVYGSIGVGATFTALNVWGGTIFSARTGSVVGGDAITLDLYTSEVAPTGDNIGLRIDEPTLGATKYQAILAGNGAGAGIWFDSAERLYSDGTNLSSAANIKIDTLIATYTGGSAFVCVGDDGVLFASEAVCP